MPISSKKSLNKLSEEVSICKKCLDLVKIRKRPVPGTGAPNSKLIIAGYFPEECGPQEEGAPFSGNREGSLMRSMLKDTGLSLESDTYMTYLVKCAPCIKKVEESIESGIKGEPTEKHISNCINYFTEEISIITPHIIVSLGLDVSNIILGNFFSAARQYQDMAKLHMKLFENPSFKLVPFYSPADVFAGRISESRYIEDFRNLSKLFRLV
jgi:uracil-DNA glycosylase family 4